jgi:hypothetical protein
MTERKKFFRVTPINPFTEIHADVLERRSNGEKIRDIAAIHSRSIQYIRNIISGRSSTVDITNSSSPNEKGIYGYVQLAYGKRPFNIIEVISMVEGDILLRTETNSMQE